MLSNRLLLGSIVAGLLLMLIAGVPLAMAQASPVEVGLVEFSINMPTTLPAGSTTFQVTNNGTMEHNFEIEGQGLEEEFETNLQPGETQTMQVDLQPGSYTVYCPVGNHRGMGMEVQLTVTEAGAAQATSEVTTSPDATEATAGGEATPMVTATSQAGTAGQEQGNAILPQTGGVILPGWGITMAVAGGLILLGGLGLALILSRRSR